MSDPVTNSQVEDVLSSIRRLVGNNKQEGASFSAAPESDRLVLTPQLRVHNNEVLRLEQEDAVDFVEDWEETNPALETPSDNKALPESNGLDEVSLDNLKRDPLVLASPEADPEPVSTENPDFHTTRSTSSSDLTAKIAALETAIAKTSDQWEPDEDDEDEYAGTRSPTLCWEENVDLDGRGTPLVIEPVEASASPVVSDEQLIDEEALRDIVIGIVREELSGDLVSQIVREELQGDLGARITRNVRKLVRREIQRAITARELE